MEFTEGISADEVVAIVDHLTEAGVVYQINGGWGVDALVGEQTRAHDDLDLYIDGLAFDDVVTWLESQGYTLVGDWLPVAQEFAKEDGWKVDLHPMVLDDEGNGHVSAEKAQYFFHPVDGRTTGTIGGREVVCATIEHQERLHKGYDPREVDVLDLMTLQKLRPSPFPKITLPYPQS